MLSPGGPVWAGPHSQVHSFLVNTVTPIIAAQKSTERRISVVSSAGTAKERVNMARHKSKARGAAMYLWSGCRGARGDSWVTPSVGDTLWLPTKRSKESCRKPSAKLFL